MTDCPSCGRYVGSYDACPHCGAALSGRTPVRVLKIAALVLVLGGLALLLRLATHTDDSTVEIGQANTLTNMANVRVEGRVTHSPSYDPETDYFSFWLADDTGEIHVAVYRNETQTLIEQGRIPTLGDRVAVEGTLRIRDDHVSLTLNVPQHLEIHRDEPVDRPIVEVTAADEFRRVRVRGQVRAVRVPYSGLTLISLHDSTGEIQLAVPEVTTALSGDLPALSIGQIVDVVAPVSLYKDTPQLSLVHAADLTTLDEAPDLFPELAIDRIDSGQVERWVVVNGRVTDVIRFSAGVKYALDDGTGRITLLLWQNVYDQLTDPDALSIGASLQALGQVAVYRGEMEIVPGLPTDVKVLAPAPEGVSPVPTATPATALELTVRELDSERLGARALLRGTIQDVTSFSKGFRFTLDDGTGEIVMLTWLETYDEIVGRERLRVGASVQVTGEIGQYENHMQIVPSSGADVVILNAGSHAVPQRETGLLTAADIGSWVSIEGQAVRVEAFSNGLRVYLDDGSGEMLLLLWANILERLPEGVDPPSIGAWLRAVGQVQEYQGTLEVVPALPFDLETVLSPSTGPTPAATLTSPPVTIAGLHAGRVGEEVTLTGQVVDTASFSKGFKFVLDDGTSQIVLLIWQDIYDKYRDAAQLNIGATVQITGEITEFEGQVQIEPGSGADVTLIAPGAPSAFSPRIGAVAGYLGQRITIVGQIRRVEETSAGTRLFVADDTGEALVFIWLNVLQRIPDQQALGTLDAQVRITGVVQEYRGTLEIVPALPYDVEILR